MSIRYRKDRGKWCVSITIQGKRIQTLCDSKKQAQEIDTQLKLKKLGFDGISTSYSIADAFASFLTTESAQKTDESRKADQRTLDVAMNFLHGSHKTQLSNVSLEDLQLFQIYCSNALNWSPTTIWARTTLLKRVFKKAFITARIQKNPCEHWKVPRGTHGRRRAITGPEFEKLIQTEMPPWLRPILLFTRLTGARGVGTAGLKWSDIDFEAATLILRSKKGGLETKKEIVFPMYPALFQMISSLKSGSQSEFVFTDEAGTPLTGHKISVHAHNAIKKSGITGICLYSLRHALAVDLTTAGVSMEITRQLMGHSSIRQTQDYAQGIGMSPLRESMKLIRAVSEEPGATVSVQSDNQNPDKDSN